MRWSRAAALAAFALFGLLADPAQAIEVRGTQYLAVELGDDGWTVAAAAAVDVEITRGWFITYAHERVRDPAGGRSEHDLSATRYLWIDHSLTLGVRIRSPDRGVLWYGIWGSGW